MAVKNEPPQARVTVDLSGQVAIVTGASQGIGRAVAETLAANGAKVAAVARNAEKLAAVVAAISEAGGEAQAFPCDVSDADAVTAKSTFS
jgi:3-oxoacyl-[acyl-carrier protein] reductase